MNVRTLQAALLASLLCGAARAQTAAGAPDIWARKGSYPPRPGNAVEVLIDGQAAYASVAEAFKGAKRFIYATVSYGDERFLPVPETGETLFDLLRARAKDGVEVKLVVWQPALHTPDTIPEPGRDGIPGVNAGPGSVQARWDKAPGYRGWLRDAEGRWRPVPLWFSAKLGCNHQKTYMMDDGKGGVVAFVGGINPVQSYWDTPAHDSLDARRVALGRDPLQGVESVPPLHDSFYALKGPVVGDVIANFVERYNGASLPHRDATEDAVAPATADDIPAVPGGTEAQIVRTIAPRKYKTLKKGDQGIRELYLNALKAAGKDCLVYIENQYFFDAVINDAIRDAAERGAKVIALLTSRPDEGSAQSVLERFMEWLAAREDKNGLTGGHSNVVFLTLGNQRPDPRDPSKTINSETYIHAKTLAVLSRDWAVMTGGSANIAFTSMLFHAEMNVAFDDAVRIRETVSRLWSEHLQLPVNKALELVKDPEAAIAYFRARADDDKVALVKGLEPPPSRVFPFGTRFPGRDLAGVDLRKVRDLDAYGPAATQSAWSGTVAEALPSRFDLPGLHLPDVQGGGDVPPVPAGGPATAAGGPAVYGGGKPPWDGGFKYLRDGLRVDTVINLGEDTVTDAVRATADRLRYYSFPFDPAYTRAEDRENLVKAFETAVRENAAGRSVYFDSGLDDDRGGALAAAVQVRQEACGRPDVDRAALWSRVHDTLRRHGDHEQFELLHKDIEDWVAHPERHPWLCAPPASA